MCKENIKINREYLPLAENFYSIQGEGYHTGKAAYFIRLGGCDVGCKWCDAKDTWNPKSFTPLHVDKIVEDAINSNARYVIITGGEPLKYDLTLLCSKLSKKCVEIYLETSGSQPISGKFDWICLSPKKNKPPISSTDAHDIYDLASELKVIICDESDIAWAEENKTKVSKECKLYLQPEWSSCEKALPMIVEYVKKNPEWNISLQTHKYMRIP